VGRLRLPVAVAIVTAALALAAGTSPSGAAANAWPHTVVNGFSTPSGAGFWTTYSDGTVAPYYAPAHGDASGVNLNGPIEGGASTPNGHGYWLVSRDGGIFSFGNANFFGSMGGRSLNRPVFSMAPTTTGDGYWLVARDGGIFSFGDAKFYGSTGNLDLAEPINGITTSATGHGYRMVARDGGIFSFGDAKFYGSVPGKGLHIDDVVGMAPTPSGNGYWIARSGGEIYSFGDAKPFVDYIASMCDPVTAIFSNPKGQGFRLVTSSGATVPFGKAPGGSQPTGTPVACPPGTRTQGTITPEAYAVVYTGMPYGDVVTLIGGTGVLVEDYKFAGFDDAFYKWNGPGSSSVLVEFVNGLEVSKVQVGLNPASISLPEFLAINPGMSYPQVVNIVGGPGQLLSQTNIGGHVDVVYRWSGTNGSSALVRFQDGREVSKAASGSL
jgi:ribosomal protein L24E